MSTPEESAAQPLESHQRQPTIPVELQRVVRDTGREGCQCGMLRRRSPFGVAVAHTRNHLNQMQRAQGGK